MNSVFLILVAVPLGVYLLVLLMSTRDIGADDNTTAHLETPPDPASVEHVDVSEPIAAPISTPAIIPSQAPITSPSNQSAPAAAAESTSPEPALIPALEPIAQLSQETAPAAQLESVQPQSETIAAQAISSAETIATVEPTPSTESAPIQAAPIQSELAPQAPAAPADPSTITTLEPDADEPILPEGPIQLPSKGSPKYAFDYRGRLWVEKKNKGFFRQLRRPQLPPDEPPNQSGR